MEPFRCPNTEEHDPHPWEVNEDVSCDGRTDCGQWSHKPHTYNVQFEKRCSGICKCGIYSEVHGPGAHK